MTTNVTFVGEVLTPTVITTSIASATKADTPASGSPPTSSKTKTGVIVGALLGGLVAGILIAIVVVLLLRFRRRRTRDLVTMNDAMIYAHADEWEKEKRALTTQLNEAQADRAQLRDYLQVADTRDPRDIVELFDKLQVSIKNSCLLASASILKSVPLRTSWTTKDANNLKRLQIDLGKAAPLALSEKGAGRTPEEFLPLALRYVVNLTLVATLFGLFHPEVSQEENRLLLDTYRDIRHSDSQQLAARWRCSTYTAIDSRTRPSSDWSNRFADDVMKAASSIVSSLFGEKSSAIFPPKLRTDLVSIGAEAYKWNQFVKSTFKALDFQPILFTSDDPFDPASMTLHLSHKPEEIPPRKIIVAVTLALLSTSIVSSGSEKREEYVWQTKAEVITEGFF